MKNFKFEKRGGGQGDFKKKDFGKKRFGGNDRGRPQMHEAICSDCGKRCEVPFKPTSDRAIYCSQCFTSHGGGSDKPERKREFEKPRFQDKPMFGATCATCGKRFELPFKPISDKPVYCPDCFERPGSSSKNTDKPVSAQYKEQLDLVNAKLDKILNILASSTALTKEKKGIVVEKKDAAGKALLRSNGTTAGKEVKSKKALVAKKEKETKKPKKAIAKKVAKPVAKKKAKK
ncbi:MAG: CxxC-x17-CxxC domain-containing protein [Candidatus Paceibacterota bacterium]